MHFPPAWYVGLGLYVFISPDDSSVVIPPYEGNIRGIWYPAPSTTLLISMMYLSDVQVYQSIKDVSANYDALVDLLESIEQFLNRLDIYIKFPPTVTTTAMGVIIVKIMVELLSTIALVTKQIKQNRPRESVLGYLSFD